MNDFLDNRKFLDEEYTRLLKPDYQVLVPKLTFCHLLCAVNRTCAAVSYDEDTDVCSMSGEPKVENIAGVPSNALVKMSFATDLNVTVIEGWCETNDNLS